MRECDSDFGDDECVCVLPALSRGFALKFVTQQ